MMLGIDELMRLRQLAGGSTEPIKRDYEEDPDVPENHVFVPPEFSTKEKDEKEKRETLRSDLINKGFKPEIVDSKLDYIMKMGYTADMFKHSSEMQGTADTADTGAGKPKGEEQPVVRTKKQLPEEAAYDPERLSRELKWLEEFVEPRWYLKDNIDLSTYPTWGTPLEKTRWILTTRARVRELMDDARHRAH